MIIQTQICILGRCVRNKRTHILLRYPCVVVLMEFEMTQILRDVRQCDGINVTIGLTFTSEENWKIYLNALC